METAELLDSILNLEDNRECIDIEVSNRNIDGNDFQRFEDFDDFPKAGHYELNPSYMFWNDDYNEIVVETLEITRDYKDV
ncbi:hypothetical protein Trydic_g14868 [Trypoxylus dichotomus]